MNMVSIRNVALAAALAALGSQPFVLGGAVVPDAGAAQKPAKVSYAAIPSGEFKIDPAHSIVGFTIRHLEISWVEGRFKDFTGTIRYDASDVTKSSVEFVAKIESIDTGVAGRDQHLKAADFFEVAKFPEMSFKSTRVERKGKGYVLTGDLTIKGVTKPVSIPFTIAGAIKDPWGNTRIGIDGQTTIDRTEFGITWNRPLENGGVNIGTEVAIELKLEALQPGPKPAGQ
jgi:polyisoprenoid-binding protein YceI